MTNTQLVGIMVSNIDKEKNKIILKEMNRFKGTLNLQIFIFSPEGINWKKKTIRGLCIAHDKWKKRKFPFPDAVYNQYYRKKSTYVTRLEKYIGGQKCFNRITFLNKWKMYEILSNTNLNKYLPNTYLYSQETFLDLLVKEKRLFLKPVHGNLGKRIFTVEYTDDGEYYIYQGSILPKFIYKNAQLFLNQLNRLIGNRKYLTQSEIKLANIDGKLFDLRILVQKNIHGEWKATKSVIRVASEIYFITNVCEKICEIDKIFNSLFGFQKSLALKKQINSISLELAHRLESTIGLLGELGIDIAVDENGKLWIIEANGKPQKKIYHKVEGKSCKELELIYRRPLEYALFLSNR